jgi:hypothetical protein
MDLILTEVGSSTGAGTVGRRGCKTKRRPTPILLPIEQVCDSKQVTSGRPAVSEDQKTAEEAGSSGCA